MDEQPVVIGLVGCRNTASPHSFQILLPASILQEKTSNQEGSATSFFPLGIVCPKCELGFVYSVQEIAGLNQIAAHRPGSDRDSLTTKIQCAREGCGTVTRWHVQLDRSVLAKGVYNFFHSLKTPLTCVNGHAVQVGDISETQVI